MMKLLNNRGVTMLEALGAIAIVGVGCLGFLGWVQFVGQGLNSANQNDAVTITMAQVSAAFGGDDRYCTAILGGLPLSASVPDGPAVKTIDYHTLAGVLLPNGNVIEVNKSASKNSDLLVADIRLKPYSVLNAFTIFGNLEVTFKKNKNSMGGQDITRKIPVYAYMKNGLIVRCSTSPASEMSISSRYCEVKSDGYDHYDPESGQCVLNEGVKYFGDTALKATCGVGYKPAISEMNLANQGIICVARTNDPDKSFPPRSYSNGIVDDSPTDVWQAQFSKAPDSSCLFTYEVTADLTKAKGQIKCAPVN